MPETIFQLKTTFNPSINCQSNGEHYNNSNAYHKFIFRCPVIQRKPHWRRNLDLFPCIWYLARRGGRGWREAEWINELLTGWMSGSFFFKPNRGGGDRWGRDWGEGRAKWKQVDALKRVYSTLMISMLNDFFSRFRVSLQNWIFNLERTSIMFWFEGTELRGEGYIDAKMLNFL